MEAMASTFSPRETSGWGRREEREKNGAWLFFFLFPPRAGSCFVVLVRARRFVSKRQRVRASIYNFPGPGGGYWKVRRVRCAGLFFIFVPEKYWKCCGHKRR
jgi:hypothetical protein